MYVATSSEILKKLISIFPKSDKFISWVGLDVKQPEDPKQLCN